MKVGGVTFSRSLALLTVSERAVAPVMAAGYDPADIGWVPRKRKDKPSCAEICGKHMNRRKLLNNC